MSESKVVLVTGTSSAKGIGFATARRLAAAGHTVYATVRDPGRAADVAADAGPGRIEVRVMDLLDRATMAPLLEEIDGAEGGIDAIVNNAGYGVIGGIEHVEVETARASFETNVWGTMALCQEALPLLRARGRGHIVLVSSCFVAGLPAVGMGYYLAAKAALETLMQSLAAEAAPHGISVSCFQPGPVMTELERVWGERVPPGGDPRPRISDELYEWVGAAGPKPQEPDEVAAALAELIEAADPPPAAQSGAASTAYAAAALRDPSRATEFAALLGALDKNRDPGDRG